MRLTIDLSVLADCITISVVAIPLLRYIYKKIINRIAGDIVDDIERREAKDGDDCA